MSIRNKKLAIVVSIIFICVFVLWLFTSKGNHTNNITESEKTTKTQKPDDKAMFFANSFANKYPDEFRVKSARTVHEDGDFSLIYMNLRSESSDVRIQGFAITHKYDILIPPGSDYNQDTIELLGIPSSIIDALENEKGAIKQ